MYLVEQQSAEGAQRSRWTSKLQLAITDRKAAAPEIVHRRIVPPPKARRDAGAAFRKPR